MLLRLLIFGLSLFLGLAPAQTTIQVDVQLVQIGFSVRDAEGRLVADLGHNDLDVYEDGELQQIARFAPAESLPLQLGVLTDLSGSQEAFFKTHRKDVEVFLETILSARDQAFLVGFGDRLRLLSDFSSDSSALIHYMKFGRKNVYFPRLGPDVDRDGGTAFFDAIYHSVQEKFAAAAGRRALVIMSDGADNSSGFTLLDAIETSQRNDVRVFGLWYSKPRNEGPPLRDQYGVRVMDRLAVGTGGESFDASQGILEEQLRRIAEDLRSSYELGYYSSNPGRAGAFRNVEIRPKTPGLTVRAKPGYFAE